MGERYLITGTQLGTLITLCKTDADGCNKMLNDIIEQQFVGDSNRKINDDLRTVSKVLN